MRQTTGHDRLDAGSPFFPMAIETGMLRNSYLSKVDLVEDDLIGIIDPPEASYESQQGQNGNGQPIVPF